MTLPDVPGIVSASELVATVDSIAAQQLGNGMIQWFAGGHADPWNHVEAAMALALAGRVAEAERAYEWLAASQLPDGSWYSYYIGDGVEDSRRDTNNPTSAPYTPNIAPDAPALTTVGFHQILAKLPNKPEKM